MARKAFSRFPFLCISVIALFFPCNCCNQSEINGMFVFGSSLVDNGNNNFLPNSRAKANHLPYGIDFPSGPTGRFTNGKNVIDVLCDKLGLPLIPVFSDPSTNGSKIIHGVNFASGASGILNDTGSNIAGEVISLNQQMKNFEEVTLPQLKGEVGSNKSEEILENYMFVVGTGGNDYSLNYFLKPSTANISVEDFTANLINSLSSQLQRLYGLGGRKFVLMSLNPLGCYPMAKTASGCNETLNEAAELFNSELKSLVDSIRQPMPSSTLILVNSYKIITDLITNASSNGFNDTSNACCEVTSISHGSACKKDGRVCEDRSTYVFFDGVHPTEAVNIPIAAKAFNSNLTTEVYPINVKQLAIVFALAPAPT